MAIESGVERPPFSILYVVEFSNPWSYSTKELPRYTFGFGKLVLPCALIIGLSSSSQQIFVGP
jgi:hypothetical protein